MSLRARLLAGVAAVALVLVVAGLASTRIVEGYLVGQVDATLANAQLMGGGREGMGHMARTPQADSSSSLYVGSVVGDRVETRIRPGLRAADPALPQVSADQAVAAAGTGEAFTVPSSDPDVDYRVLVRTVRGDAQVVVVGLPLDDVDRAVARLRAVQQVVALLVLGVLGLVTWWVLRLGVRPVKEMTETATAIAAGDLSRRVPEGDTRTEAGQLGSALNVMLTRIEEAFTARRRSEERLRQFVADASHELRTPVTTVRGYAELYRAGGLAEPSELAEAMRRTEQEAVRMGALVEDLLQLARLDQGQQLRREPVDLGAVVRDTARDLLAVDPTRPVAVEVADPVVALADEDRVRQVAANLVGNARVHTPPGTPVRLRAAAEAGRAVVEVSDDGPGMDPEVAARAFERFFRADPSRSRRHGGSGLGLSIAQAVVGALGGDVSLRSAPGHGTTVRVELDLADSDRSHGPFTASSQVRGPLLEVEAEHPTPGPRARGHQEESR
ncbi:MAG TPA: HAMP domain-containing sensor histidine kinase [Jiangellales bacterium]|nr:HAMP domain-containing sensor histidine kinase [Jiangellales bacterium]